ncbi:neuropeptide-like protein C4orf48 homolog [Cuculus canorus]|nr:neuropeptide-like protein C4orf48 homolog [Cuculus canorus]
MLRIAALILLAVCSGHFKEIITKTRDQNSEKVGKNLSSRFREAPIPKMLAPCLLRRVVLAVPLVFVVALLLSEPIRSDQEAGTAIPAESRPCVDCHAFEFMQRALQDLKKTAYNLDTRTETLLLQVEKRNLCDCVAANLLN